MIRLKDVSSIPDSGWNYPSVTGKFISGRNYSKFLSDVQEHYRANRRPEPSEQTIVEWMCANLYLPCYDDQTRQPLINRFTRGLVDPPRGCCK